MGASASSRQPVAPAQPAQAPISSTRLANSSFSAYAADLGSGSPVSRARAAAESQSSSGASAAELRDKYKRHPWPDDPANAAPTKLTNRALSKLQAQVSLSLTLTPTLTF